MYKVNSTSSDRATAFSPFPDNPHCACAIHELKMTFQGLVSYCSGVEERLVRVAVSERTGRGPKKGKKKCVRGMSVVSHTGRFAYKSIRIQVDSHTSRSFRRHDLGRFVYTEVVSPTIRIADIKVDSHTQFESIRIRNLSRFANKKVIRLRI